MPFYLPTPLGFVFPCFLLVYVRVWTRKILFCMLKRSLFNVSTHSMPIILMTFQLGIRSDSLGFERSPSISKFPIGRLLLLVCFFPLDVNVVDSVEAYNSFIIYTESHFRFVVVSLLTFFFFHYFQQRGCCETGKRKTAKQIWNK